MGIEVDTVCSHARLRNALNCIEMHLGDYCYNQLELLASIAADQVMTVRLRLTVQMAGHERKHNTRRAEIGGCASGTPISAK